MQFPRKVVKKWLYVLKLESDKYYVGITDDQSNYPINKHCNAAAAAEERASAAPFVLFAQTPYRQHSNATQPMTAVRPRHPGRAITPAAGL